MFRRSGRVLAVSLKIACVDADGIARSVKDDADRRFRPPETDDLAGRGATARHPAPAEFAQPYPVADLIVLFFF